MIQSESQRWCVADEVPNMSEPSYEEQCASHVWEVPARYNIAADVCDKHPREKQAMIWESFDGSVRELDVWNRWDTGARKRRLGA